MTDLEAAETLGLTRAQLIRKLERMQELHETCAFCGEALAGSYLVERRPDAEDLAWHFDCWDLIRAAAAEAARQERVLNGADSRSRPLPGKSKPMKRGCFDD